MLNAKKTAARAVMSCKSTLEPRQSGYFTSVATEMGTKIGPEGDKFKKVCHKIPL